jgi:hypothetical protein
MFSRIVNLCGKCTPGTVPAMSREVLSTVFLNLHAVQKKQTHESEFKRFDNRALCLSCLCLVFYRFFTISTKTKCTCLLFILLKFSYCRIFQNIVSRVFDVRERTSLMRCITEISRCLELKHLSCLRYSTVFPFLFNVHCVFSRVFSLF